MMVSVMVDLTTTLVRKVKTIPMSRFPMNPKSDQAGSVSAKMTPQPPVSIQPPFCEIENILEVMPPIHILVLITIPHSQFKRGGRVQAQNSLNWEI